jgi:ankyrin repeat protein
MNTPHGGDASPSAPRKKLPVNPSLEHLQKQAKRRVKLQPSLKLAEAQLQLAREYGCKNWAQLAKMVETMARGAKVLSNMPDPAEPLPKAAREVDLAKVKEILAAGDFTQHDLDQALAHAVWYGGDDEWPSRKAVADVLVEHGADPDGQYGDNYGPIVFGTGECLNPAGLEYLIDAGADVSFSPIETKYGPQCPIAPWLGTYARGDNEKKHRGLEILLANGAYVPPEVTPPILAIHRGDAKGLGELIVEDPTLVNRTFPDMPYGNISLRGATLLHCAVEFGEIECVKTLLDAWMLVRNVFADIKTKAEVIDGIGGQTAVYHALSSLNAANLPMLEFLLGRVGEWIDWNTKATFRFFDEVMPPLTPLEFALRGVDEATASPAKKRELELLRTADQRNHLKEFIRRGDLDEAKRLFDAHPDFLGVDLWPLAIFQGKSVEMTRLLLDRGLHPDECTAPRKPLHLAVYQCLPDIVDLLIERGADVNLRNPLDETPLELLDAYEPRPIGDPDAARIRKALREAGAKDDLYTVIRAGEVEELRALLKADPSLARADNSLGGPLFVAARSGRVEVTKLLLEYGADPNKVNSAGNTPLWFAAQSPARPASDRIAVMKLLLDAGADLHARCEDGTTALHFAAWRGPVEVVEFLLSRGARAWMTDDKDRTPKDHAVQMSNSPDKDAIIRLFSEVRILDPIFRSAVEAIDGGDVEGLRNLLRQHPGLVRQRAEEEGWFAGIYFRHPTLLHFVANNPYRHETMPPRILVSAEALLDAGAEIDALTETSNAHTVLGLVTSCEPARKAGLQLPLIDLLVRRGADPSRGLDPAVIHGEDAAVSRLLELGAKHTLLSAAAIGELPALKTLLKKTWPVERLMDAALVAASYGRIDSVEALLSGGLRINDAMTSHPYALTLLHEAARCGRRELVEWLVEHGADPTLRDTQFRGTPAGWARHHGHPDLADWLAAREQPSPNAPVLKMLEEVANACRPELEKNHQLRCKTGEWMHSAVLKIQKPAWTDGNGHEVFFSVWQNARDRAKGRFNYNIHSLKLGRLPGYSIRPGAFASAFRERLAAADGDWPNLKTACGPQTLMQGWLPFEEATFRANVTRLVKNFVKIYKIIDDLLEESRVPL